LFRRRTSPGDGLGEVIALGCELGLSGPRPGQRPPGFRVVERGAVAPQTQSAANPGFRSIFKGSES
jgi:hypothetical protein